MSDNLLQMENDGQEKDWKITARLEGPIAHIARTLVKLHNTNKSKYLRGLILLDAKKLGLSIEGIDQPGWITETQPRPAKKGKSAKKVGEGQARIARGVTKTA